MAQTLHGAIPFISTLHRGPALAVAAQGLIGHAFVGGGLFQTQQAWARASEWAAAAKREAMNAASKWRPAWAVLAGYAPVSARLHLALFYFYGVYYHWAKRATGAAYPHIHLVLQLLKSLKSLQQGLRFCSYGQFLVLVWQEWLGIALVLYLHASQKITLSVPFVP